MGNFEDHLEAMLPEATCALVIAWVVEFVQQWGRAPTPRELRAFLLRPS